LTGKTNEIGNVGKAKYPIAMKQIATAIAGNVCPDKAKKASLSVAVIQTLNTPIAGRVINGATIDQVAPIITDAVANGGNKLPALYFQVAGYMSLTGKQTFDWAAAASIIKTTMATRKISVQPFKTVEKIAMIESAL
jgi:hypothetical protein